MPKDRTSSVEGSPAKTSVTPGSARAWRGRDPAHYGGESNPFEAIKVIEDWGWGYEFCMGSAVKYIVRAGRKSNESALRDAGKALWYIRRAVDLDDGSASRVGLRIDPHAVAKAHGLSGQPRAALLDIALRCPKSAAAHVAQWISSLENEGTD